MAHLCGDFTFSTMFATGGTAMYERQPVGVLAVAALTEQNLKLRHMAANALATAEAERAESSRLRGENQRLAGELATANALRTTGRMSP